MDLLTLQLAHFSGKQIEDALGFAKDATTIGSNIPISPNYNKDDNVLKWIDAWKNSGVVASLKKVEQIIEEVIGGTVGIGTKMHVLNNLSHMLYKTPFNWLGVIIAFICYLLILSIFFNYVPYIERFSYILLIFFLLISYLLTFSSFTVIYLYENELVISRPLIFIKRKFLIDSVEYIQINANNYARTSSTLDIHFVKMKKYSGSWSNSPKYMQILVEKLRNMGVKVIVHSRSKDLIDIH